ncbi:endopeptidase La [Paracoccus homiensis]|uniref:Lon protease n=1 Tax=Paracoccus homiensis TaxID=364199 RepID=A0A1I0IY61_9RHOB|nr:endopeptidase La [Paracoccus homiensis]SEU02331.1 ATP-dependent proteinase. Serine peptidase. MEROPS family S16 [Paracoccus homiensis]
MNDFASQTYPVLPLRDIVVFPHMIVPLFVGREKSVRALEAVMESDRPILLAAQKDASIDEPDEDGIYRAGVLANVLQLLKLPDGTVKVLVEGQERVEITEFVPNEDHFEAGAVVLDEVDGDEATVTALVRTVAEEFERYVKVRKNIPEEVVTAVADAKEPGKLADLVAGHMGIELDKKQDLLGTLDISVRLEKIYGLMQGEMSVLQVEKKIKSRVKTQMEKTQREYYLNEQMKAIQKELGDGEDGQNEIAELEEKIAETKFSKEAREKADAELKKLKSMSPMSAEATVSRNYLDWLLSLPWGVKSRTKKDLGKAEQVLDADHYGLEKVKERIVEYLAVQSRSQKLKGPILSLVGPPGVGKTSLGRSIAKATGREFIRISLGGVRDESEIRGHRRTYIGSMPGKIIQALKKAKTTNPLILLDEIDKMGQDFRGDPASAMLEVLDPEQNSTFVDHYLEVEYDLSNVMFVTTANSYNMPGPLLDRMEIIPLSGYTEDEKREIAKGHLLDKQIKANGLRKGEFSVTDEALTHVIRYYTREAGVRSLEREIAKLARKAVTEILKGKVKSVEVTPEKAEEYLGVRRHRYGLAEKEDQVGVVTGLAWTSVGGDLLQIEALKLPGKGRMKTTGKLGDVMKESIDAASSFVRSISPEIGVKPPEFDKRDIHVHVPEGATPKDGPSAGIGMVTSVVSVMTGIPVRKDVAMTGEVTLRGNVLAIGGLKEKLLAALRGGIKTVLIPADNEKDLADIPENVKQGLQIIPVSNVREVLKHALIRMPEAVEWDEEAEEAAEAARVAARRDGASGGGAVAH